MTDKTPQTIVYRKATSNDLEALSTLACDTYASAFGTAMLPEDLPLHLSRYLSPASLNEAMDRGDSFLIAEEAEAQNLIAYLQYGWHNLKAEHLRVPLRDDDRQIHRVYVLDTHQNKGIGSELLRRSLASIRKTPANYVFIDVWDENKGALELYKRFGFEKVGEKPFVSITTGETTGVDDLLGQKL